MSKKNAPATATAIQEGIVFSRSAAEWEAIADKIAPSPFAQTIRASIVGCADEDEIACNPMFAELIDRLLRERQG